MAQQHDRGSPFMSAEFVLVVVLVFALLLTMLMIFVFATGSDTAAIQTSRKDLLAIILGAFGAWIGAGAAYFFGRENLRAATDSMLRMRGISPQERLMQTTLRDLKPRPLPRTFKETDSIGTVLDWFEEDVARFFGVVVNDAGRVVAAVDEEAVYRYLKAQMASTAGAAAGKSYADVRGQPLKDVVDHIKGEVSKLEAANKPDAAKSLQALIDAAVTLEEGQTAFVANETMERARKFVTIVVDSKKAPIGYITTADIRRILLAPST